MGNGDLLNEAELGAFSAGYDSALEERASQTRGAFITRFPLQSLQTLKLEEYVIGFQKPTFCYYVEVKTREWGSIQGATASKFGIYFGKTKTDSEKKYRFNSTKYSNRAEAFKAVKANLIQLVYEGGKAAPNFVRLDQISLSPMFKAKILSLYFPERFLAVCSPEHLIEIADRLGFPENLPKAEIQHRLITAKMENEVTRNWSNPKFMRFLYERVVWEEKRTSALVKEPMERDFPEVNFEEVQKLRSEIGKKAEVFALEWERKRLIGCGLSELIPQIEDLTARPGFGYDFLSHSAPGSPRYIEVKAASKQGSDFRFFLSENEHFVCHSKDHIDAYFFYVVLFDRKGNAENLVPNLATDLLKKAKIKPASYTIWFGLEQ